MQRDIVVPKAFGYGELLRAGLVNAESILTEVNDPFIQSVKTFKKDDEIFTTTTTAAWTVVYGAYVWSWINTYNPALMALPKRSWDTSGIRVRTGSPDVKVAGLTETEALPASYYPDYAYIKYPLRQMVTPMHYSRKQMILSKKDDAIPTPEQLRADMAKEHALGLNTTILGNAETAAGGAAANYDGGKVFELLDRLISADAEEDDFGGTHVGWYDPYDGSSYDRDSLTVHDAVVVYGDGTLCYKTGNPAFGTDVTFSMEAMDVVYSNCRKNGLQPENAFWLTGWDTYMRMKQLYGDPRERFFDPVAVSFSVNGVRTERGIEGGHLLSSYEGIPIIVDQNCPKDGISKVFLIDTESMFMRIATPTVYIDLGFPAFSTVSSALAQRLGYGALWLTEGELACTRFNTQGKLCSLK